MATLACNVVLLPDQVIAQKTIQTSKLLADRGVLFTLADGEFYPHISVYMLQLKTDDFPRVEQLLADISVTHVPFDLTTTRYWQSEQYIDVEYTKTDNIKGLQTEIVSALNPVRDGMRVRDEARMAEASGLKRDNYKNYGWGSVGELYRPHLTLTRFTQDEDIDELPLPAVSEFSGTFSALGLFEMGDNGTCVRKIASFKFGAT